MLAALEGTSATEAVPSEPNSVV
eukprot:SAG25_NODE_5585_length_641_cov_0.706642_2_plen_22_part_01